MAYVPLASGLNVSVLEFYKGAQYYSHRRQGWSSLYGRGYVAMFKAPRQQVTKGVAGIWVQIMDSQTATRVFKSSVQGNHYMLCPCCFERNINPTVFAKRVSKSSRHSLNHVVTKSHHLLFYSTLPSPS